MSTIATIIPTYNRKYLLKRALDSVFRQSKVPDEVIVVDDQSQDGTVEWIKQYYPQAILLQQAHAGVSAARNHGIKNAKSEWITLLDSDDQWLPMKIEKQFNALQLSPYIKICHTDEIWVRFGKRVRPLKKHQKKDGWVFEHCLPLCCVSPSSIMFHTSLIAEVGLFDESLPACEDYDMWLRLFSRYPVRLISEPLLVKYGGHSDQLSQKYWGMDRFRIMSLQNLLASNVLVSEQRKLTISMLHHKLDILIKGSHKRGRYSDVKRYLKFKQAWPQE